MVYAYIRVSTDKQTVENQRFEVQKFATEKGLVIDKWVSEKVSGTKIANDRKLGPLLKRMKKGDTLIITEISRLGRNLMGIMSMLHLCMIKETCVLTVKERYELGNNINSKVLAFAFGLSAEIERDLISQRTKEVARKFEARGFSKSEFVLRMTRGELGSFLGLKLETVSRTLTHFDELNLIEINQRHVRIINLEGLKAVAKESGRAKRKTSQE